ncbi:hypothetical protein IK146_02980 [Candidatus Saccharibacteria bacterium]|nr:hypothetical protein [Candidatus Saccharibacteria bacterium]
MFKWIDDSQKGYKVMEDHCTGVFYLVVEDCRPNCNGMATIPMVNRDGKPRTLEKLDEQEQIIKRVSEYADGAWEILEDLHTGVLYLVTKGTGGVSITVMIDKTGKPSLYNEKLQY